jgi:hypothetical protein
MQYYNVALCKKPKQKEKNNVVGGQSGHASC